MLNNEFHILSCMLAERIFFMSNLLTGPNAGVERALFADLLREPARTLRVAKLLGANAIVQLGDDLTFKDIFEGEVPISEETIIFDRTGARVDSAELLTQVEGK
jgi:hypothetical protein